MAKRKLDFNDLVVTTENPYAGSAADGFLKDIEVFLDTGSYAFNMLLSGSIYGGLAGNGITAFAGDESTGKTYLSLDIAETFLEKNPDGAIFVFDSEDAVKKRMLDQRSGISPKRFFYIPIVTVQEFRTQALKIIDRYLEYDEEDRKPMMFILDSLGMLSTTKEMEDSSAGKETKDMTRPGIIKGTFRTLTLKLGRAGVPLIVTNHLYSSVGSFLTLKEMGGGCLGIGTKIQTPNGLINIEDVKIGDIVSTSQGHQKVSNTFRYENKEMFEIEFEDGYIVKCTPEHKFLIGGNWVLAKDLKNSDEVEGV